MKRLDKLILGAFLGPFFLTFSVTLFIFLTQYLLRYLDDFLGKDLGIDVFLELIFYFSLNMVPNSLPLAILISSLMTYGNLGQHHELTAIKSSGISLIRTLAPIFIVVIGISIGLFYFNNVIVPKANLNAYSLLYDIRQKKPALNIKEGSFYNGLPGFSVKAAKKFPDGKSLKGVMIYNHTSGKGNSDVILADSGYMYTFLGDKYLALELFNGNSYNEVSSIGSTVAPNEFVQNEFKRTKLVFSLASFDLQQTQKELFASNKYMLNVIQLQFYHDSIQTLIDSINYNIFNNLKPFYLYQFKKDHQKVVIDSATFQASVDTSMQNKKDSFKHTMLGRRSLRKLKADSSAMARKKDSLLQLSQLSTDKKALEYNRALNQARSIKSYATGHMERNVLIQKEVNSYIIELHKKYIASIACIIMFLIGAPLGAIIRKGGIGIPILIGIVFFIIYYVITMLGEKWAKEMVVEVVYGMWLPILALFPVGLFFLRQAKNDARLFDSEAYRIFWQKITKIFRKKSHI